MNRQWDELTDMEQLAIKQSLYKTLADDISTSKRGNLRSRVDETYKEYYRLSGGKTYNVNVNGMKVGTFSVVAKDAESKAEVYIIDRVAFGDWVRDDDSVANAAIEWMLADTKRAEAFAKYLVELTGVMPEGCEAYVSNGEPKLTTRFSKLDPQKVASALGNALPSTIAGLLGGDTDGR